jgi:hypothetical protein
VLVLGVCVSYTIPMARPVCQPGTFERLLEIAPAWLGDVFGQLVISTYDTDGATPRSRVPGRIDRSGFSAAAKGREQKRGARVSKEHGKPVVGTVLAQDRQVRPERHAYSKSRDVDGEHGNGRLRRSEWFPHSLERLRDRDVGQISDPPPNNEPKRSARTVSEVL